MAQTMAEYLMEQGETQAKREAVLKLLRLRFDTVPESVSSRVTSIRSLSRLDSLFEKAVTAQTLDDIDWEDAGKIMAWTMAEAVDKYVMFFIETP